MTPEIEQEILIRLDQIQNGLFGIYVLLLAVAVMVTVFVTLTRVRP